MKTYSKLLIDDHPIEVLPQLAVNIGLNEAIFLQQLHYWLLGRKHFYDGRFWVYNTHEEWQKKNFPFWSVSTIKRIVTGLRQMGLVIATDQYNAMKIDKTLWYTIDYDLLDNLKSDFPLAQNDPSSGSDCANGLGQSDPSSGSDCANGLGQVDTTNNQRLPKKTTETTTKNTNSPQAAGAAADEGPKAQTEPDPIPEAVPIVPVAVAVPEAAPVASEPQLTLYDLPDLADAPLQKLHRALLGVTSKEEWFGPRKAGNVSQIDASRVHMNETGLTQALLNALEPVLARIYGYEALIEASQKAGRHSEERAILYDHIPQLHLMGIDSVEKLEAAGAAWDADKGQRLGRPKGRQFLQFVSELDARTKAGDTQGGGGKDAGTKTSRSGSKSTTSPLEEWEREHGPVSNSNFVPDHVWKKWPKEERYRYFKIAYPNVH
jgi:hypothetical protein